MAHQVPRELKGEERLFVVPVFNAPFYKKSLIYNGSVTLIAALIGKLSGNPILFIASLLILNVAVYPLGNSKRSKNKFDNGYMNHDKIIKQQILWRIKGGGNVYISHKKKGDIE